jgi:hypothetical protein
MKSNSILDHKKSARFAGDGPNCHKNSPFFCHHQDALNQKALKDLWANSLKQAQSTLVLDDELHHLDEALEGLSLPNRRGLGLQSNLGNDQGLGGNRGQSLGHGTKYW